MSKDKQTQHQVQGDLVLLQYRQFTKALRSYMAQVASILSLQDEMSHDQALNLADLSALNLERANLNIGELKDKLHQINDLSIGDALEEYIQKGAELLCEQAVFEMDLEQLVKKGKVKDKSWKGLI